MVESGYLNTEQAFQIGLITYLLRNVLPNVNDIVRKAEYVQVLAIVTEWDRQLRLKMAQEVCGDD